MSCCSCVWVVCCRRRRQQQEIKQNGEMRSGFVLSNTGAVNGDNTSMPVNKTCTWKTILMLFHSNIASVLEAPTISHEPCNVAVTAFVGTTALLPCDATGEPMPIICWYFKSKFLPGDNKRIMQLKTGALQIENIQLSDGGSYQCIASNQAGQDKQYVVLTVKTDVTDKPRRCIFFLNLVFCLSVTKITARTVLFRSWPFKQCFVLL